ncbi:MAG: FAD-binding oxidoreductase [Alphaproteobacteria bacterium]|nr:FAD-binding oxidoreductase [Alphaproteobacteria bacterium]TAD87695.1 MAG: FAD-binding oxidoreductase [Alphaproteobacteria bacterium]
MPLSPQFLDALGDIPRTDDTALVRQKSRDFYWYSPVLKRQLRDVAGDLLVQVRSEADIIHVLRTAYAHDVPVTVRGAGTGNYGQAMPLKGGVILDTTAMEAIRWIKPGAVRCEAGVKMLALDEATRADSGQEVRFFPSTKRTATVAGFIAGGSGGIGSIGWGLLRDPGNILGVRVVTMEAEPRVLELRGADIQKVNHAYGTNGVITEVEMPLTAAIPWSELVFAFPSFIDAAAFAQALGECDGIAKKLLSVIAAPIPQLHFKGFRDALPEGHAIVLAMVATANVEAAEVLLAEHGGRLVHRTDGEGEVPLYEYSWNHTTLQTLKTDKGITYLQVLYPRPNNLSLVAKMADAFGDEVIPHLEFVRFHGQVTCVGLPIVRYTTEARLQEIMALHEAAGCPIFDPHVFTLEEGGMKAIDQVHLAFKREADPKGLLNPGKMLAWDDPNWTPRLGQTHLYAAG